MELCRARSRAPAQRHTLARFPQRTEAISRVHFPTISPGPPLHNPLSHLLGDAAEYGRVHE
jgi:hypothetical protein